MVKLLMTYGFAVVVGAALLLVVVVVAGLVGVPDPAEVAGVVVDVLAGAVAPVLVVPGGRELTGTPNADAGAQLPGSGVAGGRLIGGGGAGLFLGLGFAWS